MARRVVDEEVAKEKIKSAATALNFTLLPHLASNGDSQAESL
jgi:hypothetical protein